MRHEYNQEGMKNSASFHSLFFYSALAPSAVSRVALRRISSLGQDIENFKRAVRGHWSVESMHWRLDVAFREEGMFFVSHIKIKGLANLFYFMLCCLQTGEIIEEYPDDFPYPSCLVFGHTKENEILHIVVGSDNNNVPCEECEQCGEKYYSDEVAEQVESLVNTAKQMMQEIAVNDYSKAA